MGGDGSRILIAKPGLDGHDRGAKVVARLFRDEGFEVIYTGIRHSPAAIARAAVDDDVSLIGLSILSGAHLRLTRAVLDALAEEGASDIPILVGGTINEDDSQTLRQMGVVAVFGIDSNFSDLKKRIRDFKRSGGAWAEDP